MSDSRFGAGPGPAWAGVPEDVRHVHRRAGAKAIELADDPGADDPSVRRECDEWLRRLGEGELVHLPRSRRDHLVAVAQRSLSVVLRERVELEFLLMLRAVARAGVRALRASLEATRRASRPDQIREHRARTERHVATITALVKINKELLDLNRVLILCMDFSQCRSIVAEEGAGFLDRLPPDLGAALRGGDWTSLISLAPAFADDVRRRLHSEYPGLMAFAEVVVTMPAVRGALKDEIRRRCPAHPGPSGMGGGRPWEFRKAGTPVPQAAQPRGRRGRRGKGGKGGRRDRLPTIPFPNPESRTNDE